ncbi:MAG: DUF2497 domain-containing protein [Erythrobacter sp.]|uniref:DUF2497 domain-containing protein n=1 Tax=Erythrobacter sp. TaxID=1042 RepID=UPI003C76770B
MAQDGEASVEEILESIKRVIDRDNRETVRRPAPANRPARSEPSAFELDERVAERNRRDGEEFGPPHLESPEQAPEPANEEEADEVLDLADMEVEDDTARKTAADDAPLIAEAVRGAMQENLAALAMLSEPGARPQIVKSGETSLEGLTRDLLRPMLAKWLDENLPAMVEKMVQAEIARIAGKRR